MWKTRPLWPASAAQAADWPRLAEARGSLRHDLALKGASGEPAGRGLSPLVFHTGGDGQLVEMEGRDAYLERRKARIDKEMHVKERGGDVHFSSQ